jgi:hypothetical protein
VVSNFLGLRLLKLQTLESLRSVNSSVSDAVQSQQVDQRPGRMPGSAAGAGVLLNIAGLCLHLRSFLLGRRKYRIGGRHLEWRRKPFYLSAPDLSTCQGYCPSQQAFNLLEGESSASPVRGVVPTRFLYNRFGHRL